MFVKNWENEDTNSESKIEEMSLPGVVCDIEMACHVDFAYGFNHLMSHVLPKDEEIVEWKSQTFCGNK